MEVIKVPFFPRAKRRIAISDWRPLLNQQNEKRIRLDIELRLTGQSIAGIPKFMTAAYEAMEQEDSAIKDSTFTQELEGVTIEFFSTDKSPCEELVTAATLRNFRLTHVPDGNDTVLALKFSTTINRTRKILHFADDYHGADLWAMFSEAQLSLPGTEADSDTQMDLEANEDDLGAIAQEAANETPVSKRKKAGVQ